MSVSRLSPQDQAINYSPLPQVWEIFEYEGQIYGHKNDWMPWFRVSDAYALCYQFRGKRAFYTICTHDASITRAVALAWATLHSTGRFKTLTLDLAPCNNSERQK